MNIYRIHLEVQGAAKARHNSAFDVTALKSRVAIDRVLDRARAGEVTAIRCERLMTNAPIQLDSNSVTRAPA